MSNLRSCDGDTLADRLHTPQECDFLFRFFSRFLGQSLFWSAYFILPKKLKWSVELLHWDPPTQARVVFIYTHLFPYIYPLWAFVGHLGQLFLIQCNQFPQQRKRQLSLCEVLLESNKVSIYLFIELSFSFINHAHYSFLANHTIVLWHQTQKKVLSGWRVENKLQDLPN